MQNITNKEKPIASSSIVLREEFDDWALLFDPDTGKVFGLNPVSVLIWKLLDGKHTFDQIKQEITENFNDVSSDVDSEVSSFVKNLEEKGFVKV